MSTPCIKSESSGGHLPLPAAAPAPSLPILGIGAFHSAELTWLHFHQTWGDFRNQGRSGNVQLYGLQRSLLPGNLTPSVPINSSATQLPERHRALLSFIQPGSGNAGLSRGRLDTSKFTEGKCNEPGPVCNTEWERASPYCDTENWHY